MCFPTGWAVETSWDELSRAERSRRRGALGWRFDELWHNYRTRPERTLPLSPLVLDRWTRWGSLLLIGGLSGGTTWSEWNMPTLFEVSNHHAMSSHSMPFMMIKGIPTPFVAMRYWLQNYGFVHQLFLLTQHFTNIFSHHYYYYAQVTDIVNRIFHHREAWWTTWSKASSCK